MHSTLRDRIAFSLLKIAILFLKPIFSLFLSNTKSPYPNTILRVWPSNSVSLSNPAGPKIYKFVAKSKNAKRGFSGVYVENLKYVLRNTKRLIQETLRFDYKVIITSDHSELLRTYASFKTLRIMARKNIIKFLIKFLKSCLPYTVGYYHVVGHHVADK